MELDIREFTPDLMVEVLRFCIADKEFFYQVKQHLSIDFIPDGRHQELYKTLLKHEKSHNEMPSYLELGLKYKVDVPMLNLLGELKDLSTYTKEHTLELFKQHIKSQMFIKWLNTAGDLFNKQRKEDAYIYAENGLKDIMNFSIGESNAVSLFADFDKRNAERPDRPFVLGIPFGIDSLDSLTGGAKPGETVVLLSETNMGKTHFLIHCAIAASKAGYKVAYFSAESSKNECLDKFDASWTNTNFYEMEKGNVNVKGKEEFLSKCIELGKNEIFVECFEKYGSAKIADLREKIGNYCSLYDDLKVVVIDYLELLIPIDKQPTKRESQTQVSQELKNLALEFNVLIITATQSVSIPSVQKEDPKFVLTSNHLAEDKGKVRNFDKLFTMWCTNLEYKENILHIYCEKNRQGEKWWQIIIYTNFSKSQFYDKHRTLQDFPVELYETQKTKLRNKEIEQIKNKISNAKPKQLYAEPKQSNYDPNEYDDVPF